jgi:serine/threonine-protein kinase
MHVPDGAHGDAILDELLELAAGRRRAALDRRTDVEPDLRRALEAVLAEAEAADAFLDPAAVGVRPLVRDLQEEIGRQGEDDALRPGARFAEYEVVALSGRGGMGEVYRARDGRLGRDVALKVLPADLAADPERLARFDREARLLASLNHPNIAAIYGLAHDQERQALVLEFVEGPTLAERTARGPIAVADAIAVARQVALALDAAHQRGIVHRDLKPANIKVTFDGTVKVLDFGLAKALTTNAADEAAPAGLTAMWKPPGARLGTPAYMAPEQALGQPVDQRADIWAFGCVLYEMLTGKRAFDGDTAGEVVARVIERDVDFARLPSSVPEPLQRLLRRTLVKDPRRRLSSMADAVLELEDAEPETHAAWRIRAGGPVVRTVLGLALLAGLGALALLGLPRAWWAPPAPAVRLAVPVPARDLLLVSGQQVAAISPDGRTIVYRAVREGQVHLFLRTLDSLDSHPIPGTENAAAPFFSPDGSWIGFDGDGVLRKVSLAGGSPVTICEAPGGANASWGGGTIVFATGTSRILYRAPDGGGAARPLTTLDADRGDLSHGFPHVMPGGTAALFTIHTSARRHVAVVRLDTGEVRVLTEGTQPRYVAGGRLLFARNDTLWAVPFDERRLELTGDPQPVLEGLDTAGGSAVHFAVSTGGTLMYVPRREEVRERRIVWVDRAGIETPVPFEPKRYTRASLSPDGQRIAVALAEGANTDIWIGEPGQDTLIRLTRAPTSETAPLWSPDGRSIVFRSDRDGGGLFLASVHAPGDVRRLTASPGTLHTPHGWTPDGGTLLFTEFRTYTEQAFAALDVAAGAVRPLLGGRFAQLRPHVSPDGRWLAFQSDESGRFEIYVRPYPDLDGALWKVSTAGGTSPRWSQHGRELVYHDGRGLIAVPVATVKGTFSPGPATRLFDYAPYSGRLGPDYDLTPDGQRFLMIRSAEDSPASRAQLVLVQNWTTELDSRLRGAGRSQ